MHRVVMMPADFLHLYPYYIVVGPNTDDKDVFASRAEAQELADYLNE